MNKLRAKHMATLYLDECQNMREVAELTGFSVWTVHRDLTVVLPEVDAELAKRVQRKIERNRMIRARNGGLATKGNTRRRRPKLDDRGDAA